MKTAIIGSASSGKTTLTRILCSKSSRVSSDFFSGVCEFIVPVNDVYKLAELFGSQKTGFPHIDLYDFDGFGRRWHEKKTGLVFSSLQGFDSLFHVVNAWSANPLDDFEEIDLRMMIADLESAEKLLSKIQKEIKSGKGDKRTFELLQQCFETLSDEKPLSSIDFSPPDLKRIKGFGFLTLLPRIAIINTESPETDSELSSVLEQRDISFIEANLQLESELLEFSESEKQELRKEYGFSGEFSEILLESILIATNQIIFYTANEREARAWFLKRGGTAIEAAETIHKDIAKGFIKAEVVHLSDLLSSGSWKKAREDGKIKVVGKDYILNHGEIIYIRFH